MSERKRTPARTVVLIVGLVAIVGGGIWFWDANKYEWFPKRFGVVEEGLVYRSGQLTETQFRKQLQEHGIQLVLALNGNEPDDPKSVAEARVADELGVERVLLPLQGDGTGDIEYYAKAIAEIVEAEQAGRPVLVHCAAGSYRTGGVVAAYRMLVQSRDPADAWEEMKRFDWNDKKPQLPEYLNTHMGELAGLLVERGVIEQPPDPLPVLAPE